MVVLRWCQVRRVFVGDGVAVGTDGIERTAELGRGPQHGGGDDKSEAQRLVDLVVEVPTADVEMVRSRRVHRAGRPGGALMLVG